MEYVEGADLSQIIRSPGLTSNQVLAIAGQVCAALAYAHGKRGHHRDIKPANVMVNTEGTAKVADFGLARMTGSDPRQFGQTVTDAIMGTEEYMSPEQKRGMTVDHRADIFSMGVMLYEMFCQERPLGAFEPPSARVGCDARIDQIVLKAMHRTPDGRYQSALEMKAQLGAARTPLPAAPQRRTPPPRMNAGRSRSPYVPPAKKSHAGLTVGFLLATLLVAGAIYFQTHYQKSPAKRVAPVARSPASGVNSITASNLPDFKTPEDTPASAPTDGNVTVIAPKVPASEPTPAADSPAVSAPKTAVEKWLMDLDGPRQEAFQKQVAQRFAAGVEELRTTYLAALESGLAQATGSGDRDQAAIWSGERDAFEKTQSVGPDDDSAPLRPLRAAFRQKLARLESAHASGAKTLHASYDAILLKSLTPSDPA